MNMITDKGKLPTFLIESISSVCRGKNNIKSQDKKTNECTALSPRQEISYSRLRVREPWEPSRWSEELTQSNMTTQERTQRELGDNLTNSTNSRGTQSRGCRGKKNPYPRIGMVLTNPRIEMVLTNPSIGIGSKERESESERESERERDITCFPLSDFSACNDTHVIFRHFAQYLVCDFIENWFV